ncbi:MAG: LacI family transcriptional regulator, partial [Lentisphaerae bacterium]
MNKNRNTKYHAIAEALKNQVENNRFQHQLPTISDLAERWQVSTRTMRKAVNRLKDEGVVRVIRGQGIFPTRLKRQRTHTLGLFLPSARAPLGQQLVRGTQQRSAQFLHSLVVMEYAQDRKGLLENLSLLIREQHVDGIILWVMDDIIETSVAFLKKHPVPFVLVGEPDLQRFSDCHAVTNNDSGAIAEIMMHLLGLGHRRIAFVTNSESRGLRYE